MIKLLKDVYGTVIICVLITLYLIQPHSGLLLIFVIPILIIWFIYCAYLIYTKPDVRKLILIRMSIWFFAVSAVIGVHTYYHQTTRQAANRIVSAVEDYRTKTGEYPENLKIIGISHRELEEQIGMAGYANDADGPLLFYSTTYMPFAKYRYYFQSRNWIYDGD